VPEQPKRLRQSYLYPEFGFKIGSVVVGCTVGTDGEDAGLVVSLSEAAAVAKCKPTRARARAQKSLKNFRRVTRLELEA
jgi:hypothetical protein